MISHRLSFAQYNLLAPDLVEIIVDPGVTVIEAHIDEQRAFLQAHVARPARMLLNKINTFSWSLPAINRLTVIDGVQALAIVNYTIAGMMTAEMVESLVGHKIDWQISNFHSRREALAWLAGLSKAAPA